MYARTVGWVTQGMRYEQHTEKGGAFVFLCICIEDDNLYLRDPNLGWAHNPCGVGRPMVGTEQAKGLMPVRKRSHRTLDYSRRQMIRLGHFTRYVTLMRQWQIRCSKVAVVFE